MLVLSRSVHLNTGDIVANSQAILRELAERAGITINGSDPWDIQVQNPDVYDRIVKQGTLGLGDAYMDGWWICSDLPEFFRRVLSAHVREDLPITLGIAVAALRFRVSNMQTVRRARRVGEEHYDWSNQLYQAMLGPSMAYSCGYWKDADNLDSAQYAKYELICRKLKLESGMTVLDIGCGWGGLAEYMAVHYDVKVVGVTISKQQVELGTRICEDLPVEIRYQDYRKVTGQFDRVVSVGMFEHVGYKNYQTFMKTVERLLKPGGIFLLHTIGSNVSVNQGDPWLNKHIFPNSQLPSIAQIAGSVERTFVQRDWHNFGPDYYRTTGSEGWHGNLDAAWPKLQHSNPERFTYRNWLMWEYYLLSCGALFRVGATQLWQFIFTREGEVMEYDIVR